MSLTVLPSTALEYQNQAERFLMNMKCVYQTFSSLISSMMLPSSFMCLYQLLIWYCIRCKQLATTFTAFLFKNSLSFLAVLPQQTSCSQSSPSVPPIFPNPSASHIIIIFFFFFPMLSLLNRAACSVSLLGLLPFMYILKPF